MNKRIRKKKLKQSAEKRVLSFAEVAARSRKHAVVVTVDGLGTGVRRSDASKERE